MSMKLKFIPILLLVLLLTINAHSRTCHYTCMPPSCYPYDDPATWNDTTNNPDNVPAGMNPDGSFLVDSETAQNADPRDWDYNPSTPGSEKTRRALDAARIILSRKVAQIAKLPGFARTYVSLDGRLGADGSQQPVVFVAIDDRGKPALRNAAEAQAPKMLGDLPVSLQFYSYFKPFQESSNGPPHRDGSFYNDQNCTPPTEAELNPDQAAYAAHDVAAQAVLTANLATLRAIPGYANSQTSLDVKDRTGPDGLSISIILVSIDDLNGSDDCTGVRCNKAIRKAARAAAPASIGGVPVELLFFSDIRAL
jgi:hypothetical protein